MNGFDQAIFDALGRVAGRSPAFDLWVGQWLRAEIVGKGDIVLALYWGAWFLPREPRRERREILVATAVAGVLAVLVGRLAGLAFPFRLRPVNDPSLHLHLAYGVKSGALRLWNSFPSDHGVVWGAMATGLAAASPILGALAAVVAVVLVCLPRVYLGLHYPTDILGGLAIGALIAWVLTHGSLRTRIARPVLALEQGSPHVFYALAFLATLHLADMFAQIRMMMGLL